MPLVRRQSELLGEAFQLTFVDDTPQESPVNGHSVMTYGEWLLLPATSRHMSIAIAKGEVREKIANRCKRDGISFFNVRASNVVQYDDVRLGVGAVLCPFVTLTSNICIGIHFHANLYSYVAHDCLIGDYVTFAPGVMCNGNVVIEDHAYVGTGAVIKQGQPGAPLVIGRGAVIGMGAVVTKSVPPGVTVVGNPAKQMVRN